MKTSSVLIDTNVWSELARPRPDEKVAAFAIEHMGQFFLSTLVLAEMEFGIANTTDARRRDRLSSFLEDTITRCGDRVLLPDDATAAIWGKLKAVLETTGKPIADMDLLIASQAIAAGLPLVTRNLSNMKRTGAVIINPWDDEPSVLRPSPTRPPRR